MALKARYTVVAGEVLAEKRGGVRRLYVPDPLGSTVGLLDGSQSLTDIFSYWPYGEERTRTGTTATPFQFVGTQGYYRDKIERVYVRARHYRPDLGRWMTEDPLAMAKRVPDRYRYCAGQPVALSDPSGLRVFFCCQYDVAGGIGPSHCFISTHRCGAFGFYPAAGKGDKLCGAGEVKHDDSRLKPCPGRPGVYCPGVGTGAVQCEEMSDDADFEREACECMRISASHPPNYVIPCYMCIHWTDEIIRCACQKVMGWRAWLPFVCWRQGSPR